MDDSEATREFLQAEIQRLTAGGAASIAPLLSLLRGTPPDAPRDWDSETSWRRTIIEALTALGADAVPPLIQALADTDSEVQCAAARALGAIADPSALPALVRTLKAAAGKQGLRGAASEAVQKIQVRAPVPFYLFLLEYPDSHQKYIALEALGRLRDPATLPVLIQTFQSAEPPLQKSAALALGRLGKPAIPFLLDALQAESPSIRGLAAEALGSTGDLSVLPHLLLATGDLHARVRLQATNALSQIPDSSVAPYLTVALQDTDPEIRKSAAYGLERSGATTAFPALLAALKDPHEDVRSAATRTLMHTGQPSLIPELVEMLTNPTSPNPHEIAAVITRIAHRHPIAELESALPPLRHYAATIPVTDFTLRQTLYYTINAIKRALASLD